MTTDSPAQIIYHNTCPPNLTDSPLHLAAYNGRTAKFRRLVGLHNLYSRTKDDLHNATAFTVAISRGHAPIAAICLQLLNEDLAILDAHFSHIGGPVYASRFWLRNQVLVVTRPADVQFALVKSTTLLADPEAMLPRKGLIMLLRPTVATATAQVLWLTARQPGEDRQLARIVARCAPRCGQLDLGQLDLCSRSDFEIAARRNLPEIWQQMHSSYGKYMLNKREYATCFRLLAGHQPVAERVAHFEELCRKLGGFEALDLLAVGDGEDQAVLVFQVLEDALKQFTGDLVLLDYMVELAAKVMYTNTKPCTLKEAISAVIMLHHPNQPEHTVIEWTYNSADPALMWKCLRYEPDLMSKIGCTRVELILALVDQPQREYEETLCQLMAEQFVGEQHHRIVDKLFRSACRGNLSLIAQLVFQIMKPEERVNCEEWELLLKEILVAGQFETAIMLRKLLPSRDRMLVIADTLQSVVVPVTVCEELLTGNPAEWIAEHVGILLCSALQSRQIGVFERVWQMAEGTIQLKDVHDAEGVPILFHAIYNAAIVSAANNSLTTDTGESHEIIDSDDDEESSAQKTALNSGRQAQTFASPRCSILVEPQLEASYWRIFEDLLTDGANWRLCHPITGQSLLHLAAARDNLTVARRLLALGLDASSVDAAGNVPMTYANSVPMIEMLPAFDVRHVSAETKRTPLGQYLSDRANLLQDPQVVAAFLAAGADCNQPDGPNCWTPLMMYPSVEVAALLLQAGANVNAIDEQGQTVLYAYRWNGDLQLIWLLLRTAGADLWPPAIDGDSLLQTLAQRIPLQQLREVYVELGEFGDQAKLAESVGGLCALSRLQRGEDEDDLRCLHLLLEQQDPSLDEQTSWTYNEWRLLVEQGAHISQRADKKPLDWSKCARPHNIFNELQFFAEAGFNADYRVQTDYSGGRTALQSLGDSKSQKWMHLGIAAHLIAAGADYRLRTHLQFAVLEGLALDCLYEWDEERGLRMPDVVESWDALGEVDDGGRSSDGDIIE